MSPQHPAVQAAGEGLSTSPEHEPSMPYAVAAVLRWAAREVSGWDPSNWLYEQANAITTTQEGGLTP